MKLENIVHLAKANDGEYGLRPITTILFILILGPIVLLLYPIWGFN